MVEDKTAKYVSMIEAFECDFVLARDGKKDLNLLAQALKNKDKYLFNDIKLLEELSFNLRNGKLKIISLEETMANKVISREYVEKNYIHKAVIKEEINKINLCIELQKIVNYGLNDNNSEKYHFAKKILKEILEEHEKQIR